jgi:hypothetical protein
MRQGQRVGGASVLAALVGLCVLAGCSSSSGDAVGHPTTTSSAPASTTTTLVAPSTTATTGPSTAVIAGYRAASDAFEQALSTADPNSAGLAATMVDPQLQSVKANLVADQRQGIVGRGSVTLHPRVLSVSGSTATVVDCVYSTTELAYQATGKPVPPVTPPENDGIHATLVLSDGVWKVSMQTVTDGKCGADT